MFDRGVTKIGFFVITSVFLNHRKFLKQSEIVYNGLEIKNDMAKERMVDSP